MAKHKRNKRKHAFGGTNVASSAVDGDSSDSEATDSDASDTDAGSEEE